MVALRMRVGVRSGPWWRCRRNGGVGAAFSPVGASSHKGALMLGPVHCPHCNEPCDLAVTVDDEDAMRLEDRVIFPGAWGLYATCPNRHTTPGTIRDPEICIHDGKPRGLMGGTVELS